MAIYRTGVKGFDDAVLAAEITRQAGLVGAPQGVANAVNTVYLQTVIDAGQRFNVLTINQIEGLQTLPPVPLGGGTAPPIPVVTTFTLDVSVLNGSATLG